MKEKIILIGGVIAFAILLILASNAMNNTEVNNLNQDTEISKTENQNSSVDENLNSKESEKENKGESKVVYVNESTFEAEVLNSDKIILIDFYADWCAPCNMLAPTIDEISIERNDIKVVKINVDESEDLAIEYGAISIPTLVIMKDGVEKNRIIGLVPKEEILSALEF